MAICEIYNFYECWYNLSQAKKYIFNINNCDRSYKLSNCETKTIYMSPYSKMDIDSSTIFTREGYTLKGFNEDPTATYGYKNITKTNTTYYAIWKRKTVI